jgi:triosephosphate isomerase
LISLQGSPILVGVPNMHWADEGPYTGEVSLRMLAETGIQLVELSHSEQWAYYNESDQDLNKKVKAALAHGLIPLVCVGERQPGQCEGAGAAGACGRAVHRALGLGGEVIFEDHCGCGGGGGVRGNEEQGQGY